MARTLDVEDEQGGEDAAEEELQYKIGSGPGEPLQAPAQTAVGPGFRRCPVIAPGEPDDESGGARQKQAEAPEVEGADALAEGQRIPEEAAEKSDDRKKTPQLGKQAEERHQSNLENGTRP